MSVQAKIFRQYIGGSKDGSKLKFFPEIINKNVTEFQFILAFSKEGYLNTKGDGKFKASWNLTAFNVNTIEKLKKDYPNAKVFISIGGNTDDTPFYASNRNAWVYNATESIEKIVRAHKIDGIDINYSKILSTPEDFVFCIGNLIKNLKEKNAIEFVSIAPSETNNSYYDGLFKIYEQYINLVDYKFYTQSLSTKDDVITRYKNLSSDYPSVLLAGFSTNTTDAQFLSRDTFLKGCQELIDYDMLPGISVSDADYSRTVGYEVEKLAQEMIVNDLMTN